MLPEFTPRVASRGHIIWRFDKGGLLADASSGDASTTSLVRVDTEPRDYWHPDVSRFLTFVAPAVSDEGLGPYVPRTDVRSKVTIPIFPLRQQASQSNRPAPRALAGLDHAAVKLNAPSFSPATGANYSFPIAIPCSTGCYLANVISSDPRKHHPYNLYYLSSFVSAGCPSAKFAAPTHKRNRPR